MTGRLTLARLRQLDTRRWLAIIILLGVLARLALSLALGDQATPISGAADQFSYDNLAQRVAQGYGFTLPYPGYPFTKPNEPTAHWSFLYTLFLAAVYILFGHHPLAARLIQSVLSGINLWLAYRLGRRLFGERVGLVAAALSAVYAYLLFFSAVLMTQTFYITMLLAAMELTLAIVERPTARRWLLLGLVLGLGAVLRQTLILFSPLLFAYVWWRSRAPATASGGLPPGTRADTRPWAGILLATLVMAAVVLPWTVRNSIAFHDFLLLNSNGGYWFYSSNHPDQGTEFNGDRTAPVPTELLALSEPAIDRALYREAFGFILADPKRFLLLSLNRTKDYFWLLPSENSSPISNISRVLSFTLYLPFMIYGLAVSRRRWRECLPIYLYVAFDALFCLVSWPAPRYRLPSDALLIPFAGLAVVQLAARVPRLLQWSSAPVLPRDVR